MKNTLHINSPSLFSSVVLQQQATADSGGWVVGVTYDCIDARSVFLLMLQYFSNQYLDKGKVFCNSSLLPLTNHVRARSTVQRLTVIKVETEVKLRLKTKLTIINKDHSLTIENKLQNYQINLPSNITCSPYSIDFLSIGTSIFYLNIHRKKFLNIQWFCIF